jgi:hypothetical protein
MIYEGYVIYGSATDAVRDLATARPHRSFLDTYTYVSG